MSRRNIPPGTRIILAKKLEPMLREMAREKQISTLKQNMEDRSANVGKTDTEVNSPPIDVREEIAKAARVSHGTLSKFDAVQKERPDLIDKIVSDEMTINKI